MKVWEGHRQKSDYNHMLQANDQANNHNAGELLILVLIESWFASNDSGNCGYIRQPVIA